MGDVHPIASRWLLLNNFKFPNSPPWPPFLPRVGKLKKTRYHGVTKGVSYFFN